MERNVCASSNLFVTLPMAEVFQITAHYNNEDRNFDAEFRPLGFSYKIAVQIDGSEILFEPDEERNFRAVYADGILPAKLPNPALLQAIAAALEKAFR